MLWAAITVTYLAMPTVRPEPFGSVRPEPVEGRTVAQDRLVEGRTFVVRRAHQERGELRQRIYAQEGSSEDEMNGGRPEGDDGQRALREIEVRE